MRIDAVLESAQRKELSPLHRKLLYYLEAHSDEVFTYRDDKLARDTKTKLSAVGFTLWALQKNGLIDKQAVARKVYFGSKDAISELRKRLGVSDEHPIRAR
jgi:hypothetical protein